uniref:Protein kinase domain-containing protein n=1 Tax=Chromera velia CCMP2878 TaxID=1169474 RepID=A0A0G4GGG3_9ALVE|eukprot:Cvel_21785.t1-p1 / transcript=Cvel_21785.t1 / gene=Cvel_21785 / organism=Chromera_velia_CCMP2878 / gene_product=Integrin-linked protein kinase, putative / transcript_product=Integrin-linked protein kinase, putative / location=Cvel_scaffold2074:13354-24706(-) / protein_length=1507 / sequence_SO=supercontig / SO=protein_coding / is_pseudo=false
MGNVLAVKDGPCGVSQRHQYRKQVAGGKKYRGPLVANAPHTPVGGKGIFLNASGGAFVGSVVNGLESGLGVEGDVSGTVFEGLFKDGKRHGEGIAVNVWGEQLSGHWVNGVPSGEMLRIRVSGERFLEVWSEGKRVNSTKLSPHAKLNIFLGSAPSAALPSMLGSEDLHALPVQVQPVNMNSFHHHQQHYSGRGGVLSPERERDRGGGHDRGRRGGSGELDGSDALLKETYFGDSAKRPHGTSFSGVRPNYFEGGDPFMDAPPRRRAEMVEASSSEEDELDAHENMMMHGHEGGNGPGSYRRRGRKKTKAGDGETDSWGEESDGEGSSDCLSSEIFVMHRGGQRGAGGEFRDRHGEEETVVRQPAWQRKEMSKWNRRDVCEWLCEVGVPELIGTFREKGLRGRDLEEMTLLGMREDLEMEDPLSRNRLMQLIWNYRYREDSTTVTRTPVRGGSLAGGGGGADAHLTSKMAPTPETLRALDSTLGGGTHSKFPLSHAQGGHGSSPLYGMRLPPVGSTARDNGGTHPHPHHHAGEGVHRQSLAVEMSLLPEFARTRKEALLHSEFRKGRFQSKNHCYGIPFHELRLGWQCGLYFDPLVLKRPGQALWNGFVGWQLEGLGGPGSGGAVGSAAVPTRFGARGGPLEFRVARSSQSWLLSAHCRLRGRTFEGEWHGTRVAVKAFPSYIPTSKIEDWQKLMMRLTELRHPNLCLLLGAAEYDGVSWNEGPDTFCTRWRREDLQEEEELRRSREESRRIAARRDRERRGGGRRDRSMSANRRPASRSPPRLHSTEGATLNPVHERESGCDGSEDSDDFYDLHGDGGGQGDGNYHPPGDPRADAHLAVPPTSVKVLRSPGPTAQLSGALRNQVAGLGIPEQPGGFSFSQLTPEGAVKSRPVACVVSEFLPLGDLFSWLHGTEGPHGKGGRSASGPVSMERALQIAKDVAVALAYLHSRGVPHLNLKPHNILLDRSFRAKVADFAGPLVEECFVPRASPRRGTAARSGAGAASSDGRDSRLFASSFASEIPDAECLDVDRESGGPGSRQASPERGPWPHRGGRDGHQPQQQAQAQGGVRSAERERERKAAAERVIERERARLEAKGARPQLFPDRSAPSDAHARVATWNAARTLNWTAPEALRTGSLLSGSLAADVYSFGLIFWELLSNRIPFGEMTDMQIRIAVGFGGDRPPDLQGRLPGVGAAMKLIHACLAHDPGRRPRFEVIVEYLCRLQKSAFSEAESALLTFMNGAITLGGEGGDNDDGDAAGVVSAERAEMEMAAHEEDDFQDDSVQEHHMGGAGAHPEGHMYAHHLPHTDNHMNVHMNMPHTRRPNNQISHQHPHPHHQNVGRGGLPLQQTHIVTREEEAPVRMTARDLAAIAYSHTHAHTQRHQERHPVEQPREGGAALHWDSQQQPVHHYEAGAGAGGMNLNGMGSNVGSGRASAGGQQTSAQPPEGSFPPSWGPTQTRTVQQSATGNPFPSPPPPRQEPQQQQQQQQDREKDDNSSKARAFTVPD